MLIRRLETRAALSALDGLLEEYIRFVAADLDRAAGVSFNPEELLAKTRNSLDAVLPPNGFAFLAEGAAGQPLGMGFLRPSGPEAMEIKRLYVAPAGRGQGIGKALVLHMIDLARGSGASALRLDSSRNLETAIGLYRKLGFEERAPYPESDHFDDPVLGPHLIFMELLL